MKLSIIIVNYNVKYFLEHCLYAVMLAARGIENEVIVVDNHSSDESAAYLKRRFPSVFFIENTKNTGFAKANNQGLAMAKGEYVLYLNPDTLVAGNALTDCIKFLDDNKDAAACGVQMLDGTGKFLPESKRSFPSPATSFYKLFLLEKLFPESKVFGKYALGYLDKDRVHEVDVLAGAFIMARTDLLRKINGFDERYFMYGEDIDLSLSLQQLGYKNYYLGNISIIHFKGESTKKDSIRYVKIFYQAMILFVEKHYKGSAGFIYTNFLKIGIAGRSALSAIRRPFVKKKKNAAHFEKIIFTGNENIARQVTTILQKHFPNMEMTVGPKPIAVQNAALVFCIDETVGYVQAINFLRQNAPVENAFWFYKNAGSIIGSSNKNSSGEVFT